jgi:hypothetical protein
MYPFGVEILMIKKVWSRYFSYSPSRNGQAVKSITVWIGQECIEKCPAIE